MPVGGKIQFGLDCVENFWSHESRHFNRPFSNFVPNAADNTARCKYELLPSITTFSLRLCPLQYPSWVWVCETMSSLQRYSPHQRIVLLFDLDCFYAQCERVRLGLPQDVSLALLQWNSVLAVTYPARTFGIKRGDSWEDVAEKSNNTCWAIHLHVLERTQEPSKAAPVVPAVKNPYQNQHPVHQQMKWRIQQQ
jgi:hypothetical protein